uniref:Ribonuclease PIN domain-containing protein n=1 Tax=Amphimedon queenslandica TaxID=400682 RepID=A0A1X7TJQ3_AMPQE
MRSSVRSFTLLFFIFCSNYGSQYNNEIRLDGVALQDWSQTVYTIRDVISEIKDSETCQRLQVLPYELILREPSQEYIKHVI